MVQVFERWPLPQNKGAEDFVEGFALAQQQKRQQEQLAMQKEQAEAARRKEARQAIEDVVDRYVAPTGEPGGETASQQFAGIPQLGQYQPQQIEAPNEIQRREKLKNVFDMIDKDDRLSAQEKTIYKDRAMASHERQVGLGKALDTFLGPTFTGTPLEREMLRQRILSGKGLPEEDIVTMDVKEEDGAFYRKGVGKRSGKELWKVQLAPPEGETDAYRDAIAARTMKELDALAAARGKGVTVVLPDGTKKALDEMTYAQMADLAQQNATVAVDLQDRLRRTPGSTPGGVRQAPGSAQAPGPLDDYDNALAELDAKAEAIENDPNSTPEQKADAAAARVMVRSRRNLVAGVVGGGEPQGAGQPLGQALPPVGGMPPSGPPKPSAAEFAREVSPAVTFGLERGTPSRRTPAVQPQPEPSIEEVSAQKAELMRTINDPNTPVSLRSEASEQLAYVNRRIALLERMPEIPGIPDSSSFQEAVSHPLRFIGATKPALPTPENLRAEMDAVLRLVETGNVPYAAVVRGAQQYKQNWLKVIDAEKAKGAPIDEAMEQDSMRAVDEWERKALAIVALNKAYSARDREAAFDRMAHLIDIKRSGNVEAPPRGGYGIVEPGEAPDAKDEVWDIRRRALQKGRQ